MSDKEQANLSADDKQPIDESAAKTDTPPQPESSETQTEPRKFAGKYDTPEALEEGYKNQASEYTKLQRENKAYRDYLSQLGGGDAQRGAQIIDSALDFYSKNYNKGSNSPPPSQGQNFNPDAILDNPQEVFNQFEKNRIKPETEQIKQELAAIKNDFNKYKRLMQVKNDPNKKDWDEHAERINQFMYWGYDPEAAYRLAKSEKQEELVKKTKDEAFEAGKKFMRDCFDPTTGQFNKEPVRVESEASKSSTSDEEYEEETRKRIREAGPPKSPLYD